MENQLLISKGEHGIITAWTEEGRICQLQAEPARMEGILDNIYIGKVRNIVKNIDAAFVEFQKGQVGYLSLQGAVPIHTEGRVQDGSRVLIGDEIIVQVSREAVKTKPPTLSGTLELSGKYVVLSLGEERISVSRKIKDKAERGRIQGLIGECGQYAGCGWVARTNILSATKEELSQEMEALHSRLDRILEQGKHLAPFACLYQAPAAYLGSVRDMYQHRVAKVLTDDKEIFGRVQDFLAENCWEDKISLSLWDEEQGRMDAVYDISRTLTRALREKVWLKSGAYLVIQPTEALVSIDVNTGKAISKKKDVQRNFLKVNLEAAREIAFQLRLRNLSGIVLVDFIDMADEEARRELLELFRAELGKDPVPAKLVDMTKLGLVEVTRKKVRMSLAEQIELCRMEERK